jgi:hypothetical protein
MRVIKVIEDQTLLDVAVQEYGNSEGVFWLVEDNPNLNGITDNIFKGDELLLRDKKINKNMVNFLSEYSIATAKDARGEGIGYWIVGNDFIVS